MKSLYRKNEYLLFSRRGYGVRVPLTKPVDSTSRIHQFLSPRKERVAFRADFHSDVLFRGSGMDHIAASAGNRGFFVLGMYSFSHKSRVV